MSRGWGQRPLKWGRRPADELSVSRPRRTGSASRSDAGFSLVEVLVALVVFALMSTAVIRMVVTASKVTSEDAARTAANYLAVRELEIVRDTFTGATRGPDRVQVNRVVNPSPLPGGTAGQPLVVDRTKFTVVRTAQWASVGSSATTSCDEGSTAELAYLKVQVEVSWPSLGDRDPVRMNTVMTPPKGSYSLLNGHIGLKVIDRLGQPVSGALVTAKTATTTRTGYTSDDGCVLLAFLDAGTYTITMSTPGSVNPAGDPTARTTAIVQQGQLWRGTIEYDVAASITATFQTAPGYTLPPSLTLPVSLGNSALQPGGSRAVTGSGTSRTISPLWPYPSGYQLWGGACAGSDPNDGADLPVDADPGGASSGRVYLAPVRVTGLANTVVTATSADTACTTANGSVVNLGPIPAGGTLLTSLPYGSWKISRPANGSGSAKTVTITVVAPTTPVATPAPAPAAASVPVAAL